MGRKKELTPEEIQAKEVKTIQERLDHELKDLIHTSYIPLPSHPDRIYKVGDRVKWGNHKKSIVLEVSEDKRFYKIETSGSITKHNVTTNFINLNWQDWVNIFPYREIEVIKSLPVFSSQKEIRLIQYNSTIETFFSMVHRFGVDFDVEYQRDYVWSLEDKQLLIDSILNKNEIGKFLFIKREWNEAQLKKGKSFEILDGKQRLSTIIDFYESKFQFKGKYYHELSPIDQYNFTGFNIAYMEADGLTEQERIQLFIRFNTTGKTMDMKHIEDIKKLLI